jgi:small subunit ribosomal protein S17
MDKSVVVLVESLVKHRLYMKYVKRQARFAAHDKENACHVGDKVLITETRPLSKTKRWRVSEIIEKAV